MGLKHCPPFSFFLEFFSILHVFVLRLSPKTGHVQRMEEGRLPKEVIKWSPPGRRKLGRPKLNLGGRD